MKHKKIITASAALMLLAGTGTAGAAGSGSTPAPAESVGYTSNGQAVTPSSPAINVDGSLYLPVRAMGEALGKYVDWDEFRSRVALTDKPVLSGKFKLTAPDLAAGIKMGIGSSLLHLPGDADTVFYTTADRGPNGEVDVNGKTVRTFPLPDYTPTIYKIDIKDGQIHILEQFPLKVNGINPATGKANITGLPNIKGRDEAPYNAAGDKELAYDPYGLDVEGLTYNPKDDTFWISDEYGPSLIHVKRDGTLIERIVPKGWAAQAATPLVPARETLPAVYNKLRQNRGAEAVSITPDGSHMFMAMQSPLRNPGKDTDNSRQLRIIKFDLATLEPVAEYVYVAEDAGRFKGLKQSDIVISDMIAVDANTLLIDERDKNAGDQAQLKRIYAVDLSQATNVLGKYDDAKSAGKTLEQMSIGELRENGILPPSKRTVVDLVEFKFPYEKVEGLALVNGNTLAIVNDNDFGVGSKSTENGTELWTFKLPYGFK